MPVSEIGHRPHKEALDLEAWRMSCEGDHSKKISCSWLREAQMIARSLPFIEDRAGLQG